MKLSILLLTVVASAAFVGAGCNKQPSTAGDNTATSATSASASTVDTSKFEAAFASADAATKSAADTAVTAIKNADYSGAVTQLQSFASKFQLTAEQQQAVTDTLASLKTMIADSATKMTAGVSNAATDMSKTLGK